MSKITGKEPNHWHDGNGGHRMPDPRRLAEPEPIKGSDGKPTGGMSAGSTKAVICHGDPDLAAYWNHLDEHDRMASDPVRGPEDSPKVRALFDKLEGLDRQRATTVELIRALREIGQ